MVQRTRARRKPLRIVPLSQRFCGIAGHARSTRDLEERPSVRTQEPQLAVGLSLDLITLLVNGTMVPAAEQGEIGQRRGAALGPVTDVVTLSESAVTAREAATVIAMLQGAP